MIAADRRSVMVKAVDTNSQQTFENESQWIQDNPGGVSDPSDQTDVNFIDVQHVVWISESKKPQVNNQ